MPQDRLLAEMIDHKEVRLVEAGVEDARQNRLVIGQELLILAVCLLVATIR